MILPHKPTLAKFRLPGPCRHCGRVGKREAAHVIPVGRGGGNRLDVSINLVSLGLGHWSGQGVCRCHALHHDGHEPTAMELRLYAAAAAGALQDDVKTVCDWILRQCKYASDERLLDGMRELNDAQRVLCVRTLVEAGKLLSLKERAS